MCRRCGDGRAWGRLLNFTTLQAVGPDAFPQRFGIVGDLGQTQNSSVTLRHLTETDPPVRPKRVFELDCRWACAESKTPA